MANLNIYNIAQATNLDIARRLDTLNITIRTLEQSMKINRNCHRLMEGITYEVTMIKWSMQSNYERMERDWGKAMQEECYLTNVQDDRIYDYLSGPDESDYFSDWLDTDFTEDRGDVDNPALDGVNVPSASLSDDDLPF